MRWIKTFEMMKRIQSHMTNYDNSFSHFIKDSEEYKEMMEDVNDFSQSEFDFSFSIEKKYLFKQSNKFVIHFNPISLRPDTTSGCECLVIKNKELSIHDYNVLDGLSAEQINRLNHILDPHGMQYFRIEPEFQYSKLQGVNSCIVSKEWIKSNMPN